MDVRLFVDGFIEDNVGSVEAPSETSSSLLIAPSETIDGGSESALETELRVDISPAGAVAAVEVFGCRASCCGAGVDGVEWADTG